MGFKEQLAISAFLLTMLAALWPERGEADVRTSRRTRIGRASKSRSQSRSVQEGDWRLSCLSFLHLYISTRTATRGVKPVDPCSRSARSARLVIGSRQLEHARRRRRVPAGLSLLTNHGRKRKVRSSHLRRVGCHGRTMVTTQPRRVRHQPKASPPPNRGSDKAAAGSAFCLLV